MLRRRHRAKERTRGRRILFATDVHGSERCFRKFLNAAPLYEIDYPAVEAYMDTKGALDAHMAQAPELKEPAHA